MRWNVPALLVDRLRLAGSDQVRLGPGFTTRDPGPSFHPSSPSRRAPRRQTSTTEFGSSLVTLKEVTRRPVARSTAARNVV